MLYSTDDGLSNNVICGLAEDKEGNIWCSTFKGINQIKIAESRIINYYTGNGLIDKEYSRGVYFYDKEDNIYFGGSNGITRFSPALIMPEKFLQEVMIMNMYLGNQPITSETFSGGKKVIEGILMDAKNFRLSHEDNTFTFEFSTMDFREPENIHYEYRLKELSTVWNITLSGVNRITYSHLSPGNYTLEVRACENGTYTPVKQVGIHISPPWYQTTVAYICYLLLLVVFGMQFYYLLKRKQREEINEEKLKFFINISHEIRSPMTLIISPLETLLRREYDEPTTKALRSIYKNANRIVGLINQLLDIRRIDKGQMKIHCSETDIVGFIDDLFQAFDYQAEKRGIQFTFEHTLKELPVWIDRNNFDKVLVNLFSNAFKYTPSGGTILFSVNVDEVKKCLYIQVADTGVGIPKEKQGELFKRFMQSSFSGDSIGVGLHLSHELVQVHKGTIEYKDNEGGGSVFTVCIPTDKTVYSEKDFLVPGNLLLEEANMQTHHLQELSEECQEHEKTVTTSRKHKILVIEDDNDIRGFLQEELSAYFEVEVAADGISGFEKACNYDADLIICDVLMPGMTGFEVTKKLKTEFATSHIPIILLTALTSPDKHLEGLEAGADVYVAKPFSFKLLLAQVFRLIEQCEKLRKKFSSEPGVVRPALCNTDRDKEFADQLVAVVEKIYSQYNISIDEFAQMMGMGRTVFYKKLRGVTGYSPNEYLRVVRMKKAAELFLTERDLTVAEVSYKVGINDPLYFSKCFKAQFGVSPSAYQKGERSKT